jgi:hypothetical protein
MPAIPLGRSAYAREGAPPTLLKNYYFETTPTNLEDQASLRARPRLKAFAQAGSGPIRGLYREGGVIAGRILCLSGTTLYKIEQTGVPGVGTATSIGTVDGTGHMSAEGAVNFAVLTCGTTAYATNGITLTTLTAPDSVWFNAVDTLDKRFLFAVQASNRFYWSDPVHPESTSMGEIDGLSFAAAESQPDVLITLKVVDDVLWLVGRLSLEAWRGTGDADLPYERIEGRVFGIGCTARETVQKMNIDGLDTMCWVGTDRKVYWLNPNPERISDFGLEERLGRATPEALYGHHALWNGHDFYVLHIPGEGTFAYDLTTRAGWAEWTSFGRALFRSNVSTIGPNAQSLLGDATAGIVFELSEAVDGDHGENVVFEVSGQLQVVGPPARCHNALLGVTAGRAASAGDDPLMQLSISDDGGETWAAQPDQPLGRQGRTTLRVMWTRLGMLRREGVRLFRWRTTAPVTINTAKYNEGYR